MSTLHIGGISVQFPHAPYPCQVVYMEKVILALKGQKNALLESPTGTGKTMSLLCSSLAWQTSVNAARSSAASSQAIQYSSVEISASFPVSFPALKPAEGSVVGSQYNPIGRPGFIIYASRTHAQLQQVVQELKRTAYAPNVVILGSRDQLCINDSLKSKHLKGSSLDQACNSLCSQHRCYFKNNAEKKNQVLPPNIMDIEDAVTFGRTNNVCPYFASRNNAAKADLILMPYNYLLDNSIRASLQLEWHKAVVIFDEAHNLEEVRLTFLSHSAGVYLIFSLLGCF